MAKVWFITRTSKGFGRIWAEAALARGDRVVATARNADTLAVRRGPSVMRADPIAAYEPVHARVGAMFAARRDRRGDPQATGPAILEIVDAENPPLRVFFGDGPLGIIREEYARRLGLWEEWAELSVRAHGDKD